MMGGSISVESEINKGSTFNVLLKNLEINSMISLKPEEEKDISKITFEPAKILIVDDINNNRELIINFLGQYNFEVFDAENGAEAIKISNEIIPDLILMDLKMPIMDGYEATKF